MNHDAPGGGLSSENMKDTPLDKLFKGTRIPFV